MIPCLQVQQVSLDVLKPQLDIVNRKKWTLCINCMYIYKYSLCKMEKDKNMNLHDSMQAWLLEYEAAARRVRG